MPYEHKPIRFKMKKKPLFLLILIILAVSIGFSQKYERQRIPLIGSYAPSFKAPSTNGNIAFPEDFGKSWKILFAHPRDFTPVCSSEILELARLQDEFIRLNTQIIVISVDRLVSHQSWKKDLEDVNYKGLGKIKINFPLVVDSAYAISNLYGMLDSKSNAGQSVRGVFFVDPKNKIRAFQFYPNEVGRNSEEIVRVLKALQMHHANNDIVTPSNWQPGGDVMIPFLSKDDKEELKKPDSKIYYLNWYMIFKKD